MLLYRENIREKNIIRNFWVVNGNLFLKKVIRKFGPRKVFFVPQTLCQVSAHVYRYALCLQVTITPAGSAIACSINRPKGIDSLLISLTVYVAYSMFSDIVTP